MSLERLLQPFLGSGKTAAEITAILNAKTIQVTDSEKYTWAGLSLKFGTVTVAGMRTLLVAVPDVGPLITEILSSTGIDFSLEESQTMLTSLEPVLGADRVAALKAIGRRQISPWNADGTDEENSVDLVESDVASVFSLMEIKADSGAYWSRVLAVVNPMLAEGRTKAEIQSAVSEVV